MSLIKHIALILLIGMHAPMPEQAQVTREYQLKAAFLYNFCQFVDWPANAFTRNDEPLIIGVFGDNPFGHYLDETVKGEKIDQHPIVVKYYDNNENGKCHLAFIALNDPEQSSEIVKTLKGKSTLTIGDQRWFLEQDGMIRFVNSDNKIRFQINVDAVKEAGLEVSSKLLRLADIYASSKN